MAHRETTQDYPRLETSPNPISPLFWLMAALFAGLMVVAYWTPLTVMYDRWTAEESYYSHGLLVPFVALFFIWRDREELMKIRPQRSWLGLAMLLAGLLTLYLSGLVSIFFTANFAFLMALYGLIGFLFGPRMMRRMVFPFLLLLFMVPLPMHWITKISMHLKLMVADVTIIVMNNLMGIASVKDGSTIYLGDTTVTVGNACSGLRSLISLIFLGVLFAAMTPVNWKRRLTVFLASLPIALIANVVRVLALCLIAYHWGGEAVDREIMGVTPHDASGYLIFVVAFALLYGTLVLVTPKSRSEDEESAETEGKEQAGEAKKTEAGAKVWPGKTGNLKVRVAVAGVLVGLAALAGATILYPTYMESGVSYTEQIPSELNEWSAREIAITQDVKAILETDDVIQRNYYSPFYGEKPVQLAVVYSPTNRRVAHPPEICYTGGGWEATGKEVVEPEGVFPMVKLTLGKASRRELVYYVFLAGDDFTANYYQQQINILRNLVLRKSTNSALVRYSTHVYPDESMEHAEERMQEFVRVMMDEVETALLQGDEGMKNKELTTARAE